MVKNMEIERRYLLPPCSAKRFVESVAKRYTKIPIEQIYLPSEEGSLRYRRWGKRYIRTFKRGEGMVRSEEEREVTREEYRDARGRREGRPVTKTRYRFRYRGRLYELDRFKGDLEGLVLMETEFDTPEEAEAFTLPPALARIVLDEVTEERAFTNHALALHGIPTFSRPKEELLEAAKKSVKTLEFPPYQESATLLQGLIYAWAQEIRRHRKAILAGDRDPEHLHRLRVALRKIRSFLAFYEEILGRENVGGLRRKLGRLMRGSNDTRDLDVMLCEFESLHKNPAGIEPLFSYLREERTRAYRGLTEWLDSPLFAEATAEMMAFVEREAFGAESRKLPAILAAGAMLRRQEKRLSDSFEKPKRSSAPEAYHRVRIEVKKLRYLLEGFAPVFEPEAYAEALRQLKKYQAILGEHQDREVQLGFLRELRQRLAALEPDIAAAAGKQIGVLEKRIKKLRKKFLKKRKGVDRLRRSVKRALCRM